MKKVTLFIITAFIIGGCSGSINRKPRKQGKTTCSPLVYSTSSTTIDCDRVRWGSNTLPQDQLQFMAGAYEEVSTEVSQGQGAHIEALSALLSCKDSKLLALRLRSNYSVIFNSQSNPVNSLHQIHSIAQSDPSLRNSCSRISGLNS